MRHRKNRRLALAYALIVAVELLATVLAGWAVARWAIPYAYAERGYWAVGGEWILTAGAALFALWATNHMFFGGVRNAGKVQKMPQDTYDASGGGGGVRAGMLRQGVREVVVLDLKGNTLGRFVTENTNAHAAGGKAEEDRADAIADCRCNLQPGCGRYKTLTALDKGREDKWELNRLVYLGWPLIRWINQDSLLPLQIPMRGRR